ncbi:UNVERIFIED_CONTAM: hypothetical protein GTU68_005728 [Idotea baltica]|nr:hypothetical protein [Idotea baltica]
MSLMVMVLLIHLSGFIKHNYQMEIAGIMGKFSTILIE